MTTKSLTALDYVNYQTVKMPKKITKLSLGGLESTYVPAQPVLSCRTVDIDLPGTRTYRQKSTLDILEEHQRLIRKLCSEPRVSASAPPRGRTLPSSRSASAHRVKKVNIEVKGRPLTSGPPFNSYHKDNTTLTTKRRPKTAGQLKNIHSLTDCHVVIREDQDLLAISHSNQELSNKLHSYWKSEKNTLAVGKFIRGQKRPDDCPPTLDSWLTFGGAAGVNNKGVIDAFASFKNAEEYYNIEGSVGSHVARQLQKGGKIRIGINGILQAQDLKVKKWRKDNMFELKTPFLKGETKQEVTKEVKGGLQLHLTESTNESRVQDAESRKDQKLQEMELTEKVEPVTNIQSSGGLLEDDFKELLISDLDDFQENTIEVEMQKPLTPPKDSEIPAADMPEEPAADTSAEPAVVSSMSNDETVKEALRLTTPLSWSDQCVKSNIKIIHAKVSHREIFKPVASETFPVKFEKLINGGSRPNLTDVKSDGYKIKQRSAHRCKDSGENASKIKVLYIDPLTTEEEKMVNGLSVDKIIKHKLKGTSKENTDMLLTCGIKDQDNKSSNENVEQDLPFQTQPASSTRTESRSSYPTFYNSLLNDRGSVHSPKLKVTPVHSSGSHPVGNLRIMSAGSKNTPTSKDIRRTTKIPGKLTPAKPLHRTSAGQGSSIKTGVPKGETEYIKITSQLKVTTGSTPPANLSHHSTILSSQISPGRNSPQDLDYQVMDKIQLGSETSDGSAEEVELSHSSNIISSRKIISTPMDDSNTYVDANVSDENYTKEPESAASVIAPISIPTADEDPLCQSLSRYGTTDNLQTVNA